MGTVLTFIGMCVIAMIFTPKEKIEEMAEKEYEDEKRRNQGSVQSHEAIF